jgi:peptidoglycan/LPS O-acetylase OafA/YrhL
LPIELFISFLVPVGILLASRNTSWLVVFTLVLIGPLGASYFILHFTIGILLAKYHASIRLWLEPRRGWKIIILLTGIFLYSIRYILPVVFNWNMKTSISWVVTGFGAAMFLIVVIASQRARSFLSFSFLRFIGRVSFSVYLLHYMVIIVLVTRIFHLLNLPASASALGWWLGLGLTVLATLGLAALTHRFVEVPSMTFGKSLPKRYADWKMRRAESQSVSGN